MMAGSNRLRNCNADRQMTRAALKHRWYWTFLAGACAWIGGSGADYAYAAVPGRMIFDGSILIGFFALMVGEVIVLIELHRFLREQKKRKS